MQLASLRIVKAALLVFLVLAAVAWLTRSAASGEPSPRNSVIELCENLSRIEANERVFASLLATLADRLAWASAVHDVRHPALVWLRERIAELEAELERARACEPKPAPEGRLRLLADRR